MVDSEHLPNTLLDRVEATIHSILVMPVDLGGAKNRGSERRGIILSFTILLRCSFFSRRSSPVPTENSFRNENAEFTISREMTVGSIMNSLLVALLALMISTFRTRVALQAEILALRHQLAVLQHNAPRRLRLQCPELLCRSKA